MDINKESLIGWLHESEDEPVEIEIGNLEGISISDISGKARFRVISHSEGHTVEEMEGEFVIDDNKISVFMFLNWYRKYWSAPLGMPQHLDLLRRYIEFREKNEGDVHFWDYDDEGDWCHLNYEIIVGEKHSFSNLKEVYEKAKVIEKSLNDCLDHAQIEISEKIESIKSRIELFSGFEVTKIVDEIKSETHAQRKGQLLEVLLKRLFESISGFEVTDRVRTSTEEIDLVILNTSVSEFWKKESPVILVEAKNQKKKTDKNDVVQFRSKIKNRSGRAKLGIMVSSASFTRTVREELLRSSEGDTVIITLLLSDIIERCSDFEAFIIEKWKEAVTS